MKTKLFLIISFLFLITCTSAVLKAQDFHSSFKNPGHLMLVNDSCAGGEIHDDNSFENSTGLVGVSEEFVIKMQPSTYPWAYTNVCWVMNQTGGTTCTVDIVFYDNTGSGGSPGNSVYALNNVNVTAIPNTPAYKWYSAVVAPPALASGYYWVGIRMNTTTFPNRMLAFDAAPAVTAYASYFRANAGTWSPLTNTTSGLNYRCFGFRSLGSQPPGLPLAFNCSTGNTYTQISGTPGPSGDDMTITVTIPFTFMYLGNPYTQASICTNGWITLGTTTDATYVNDLCLTTAGTLPKLCPFWDDLNTAAGGNIQYTTQGTTPNRIFIVQWQNVGYFSGTGNVTFQVRLYETSGLVTFSYGPSVANASASGSVGITDNTGGANHVMSFTPGTSCANTTFSMTSCNNSIPYVNPNLADGVMYSFGGLVGIHNEGTTIPNQYFLAQNYPNPFNPSTTIKYGLPKSGNISLVIYDLLGREVKTLVNQFKQAGTYEANFDASSFASGVYLYRITAGDFTDTKRLSLVK